jgi:transposase
MRRTEVLQGLRRMKFEDIYGRWQQRRLSQTEAAEILGMSERTFRRWRGRYHAAGLEGLADRRLGKASARRAPVDQVDEVLTLYRERYPGFTAKHFHDELCQHHDFRRSYTWTKLRLQDAGLVAKAPRRSAHRKRRPRRPLCGMLLHQACPRAGGAGPVGRLAAPLARGAGRPARSDRHPHLPLGLTPRPRSIRPSWSRRKARRAPSRRSPR